MPSNVSQQTQWPTCAQLRPTASHISTPTDQIACTCTQAPKKHPRKHRTSTLTSTLTGTDTGAISAAPGVSEPTPTATAFEEEQPHTTWDKRVLQKLAHARVVRHTSRDVVQDFKETLADMCREVKKKIVTSLEQAPRPLGRSVAS